MSSRDRRRLVDRVVARHQLERPFVSRVLRSGALRRAEHFAAGAVDPALVLTAQMNAANWRRRRRTRVPRLPPLAEIEGRLKAPPREMNTHQESTR